MRAIIIIFFLKLGFAASTFAQTKIADTIYYNQRWQICEAPIASYYRVGALVMTDSGWCYSGAVKDYTVQHRLLMKGAYAENGLKHGNFVFYFPDGNMQAKGQYNHGQLFGVWKWFHLNGKPKAEIYYPNAEQQFAFTSYNNEDSTVLLKAGTGKFNWNTDPFKDSSQPTFNVTGHFKNGYRSGTWHFSSQYKNPKDQASFKEYYDENGKFLKTTGLVKGLTRNTPYDFNFTPLRLQVIEGIAYDRFFNFYGDSLAGISMFDYFVNRKPSEIKVPAKRFDSAYAFIIGVLNHYINNFNYPTKELDGKIEFRLGAEGYPADVTITGKVDSNSKKLLMFLIEKFKNIDMPAADGVAFEGYHQIYFYSINLKDYFPASVRGFMDDDFLFSGMSKEKTLQLMQSEKKKLKKYLRHSFVRYQNR